jgi:MYXO-CTERM domain-containing protein
MKKLFAVLAVAGLAASANAVIVTETGDAGLIPFAPAQDISGGPNVLDRLDGALLPDGSQDVDVYRITIANPAAFSAIVSGGTLTDTTIYLFNLNGTGIAKNDDISGSNFLSAFPVGDANYATLPAGDYLFAISIFGVIPFSVSPPTLVSQNIFDVNQFTGVQGPVNAANPVLDWAAVSTFVEGGSYEVSFTGVTTGVPAPGAMALLGLGGLVAARRRRN